MLGLMGGAFGAVLGARFGAIGAVLGGVAGFLAGGFLASQLNQYPYTNYSDNMGAMLDNQWMNRMSYYSGYSSYNYGRGGNPTMSWLPALGGAVMGAALGAHGGLMGIVMGGLLGFIGGKIIGAVLFPQSLYDPYGIGNVWPDPYNNINNFRNFTLPGQLRPGTMPMTGAGGVVVRPFSPSSTASSGGDLEKLRQDFFAKLDAYQKAAGGGDTGAADKARKDYESARDAYMGAKNTALQASGSSR
jgi:hypothetical protein